jgi:hypothetical protein
VSRARVYRNIDATSAVLGLAMPYEAGLVGLVAILGIAWAPPLPTIIITVVVYLALRIAGRGKPPGYLQDLLPFHLRRLQGDGRFSAVARSRGQPRFPFAPFASPRRLESRR